MKNLVFTLVIYISASFLPANKTEKLEIGDQAVLIEMKMENISDNLVSLKDAANKNGLVVLFSCNTCPFVLRWEDRYLNIKNWADKNDVGMIVLNSNYQKRKGSDSLDEMKKHAREQRYTFSYAVDKESKIANAFGAQTTPHAFLFDGNMRLVYKGAIDDNYKSADNVQKAYLKDAISSLGNGTTIDINETKPVGCGIKRKLD